MLVQNGVERAVITRNSAAATQIFMDKLNQQLIDNRHLYPLLEPNKIFSEVYTLRSLHQNLHTHA